MDSFAFDPIALASPLSIDAMAGDAMAGDAKAGDAKPGAPRQRDRLAIVSTTNRLCGIAAYTAALSRQLNSAFDVTILDLDQYLLRGGHPRLRKLGDRHIADICDRLRQFDAVNLQLEYGTLGRSAKDIYRRLGRLVEAAPSLSITFHTLLPPPEFPLAEFGRSLCRVKLRGALRIVAEYRRNRVLSLKIAQNLRRAQRRKPITAIAHNRRDQRELRHLYGIDAVFDHPLAFLSAAEIAAIRLRASRRDFPILDRIPAGATLIGVFGFLNDYKGLSTAVRALQRLPDNHHLLIFGGIHPNEIAVGSPLHPYLARLFQDAYADATPYGEISAGRGDGSVKLAVQADRGLAELIGPHPRDVSARIHFMGAAEDDDFLCGMASCDAVVIPYLEVGQSSSGPISQALELGCRVIASRTHTFLGFADYHPGAIEFFDIGNYLELAERIRARRQFPPRDALPAYNVETNKAVYVAANTRAANTRAANTRAANTPAASAGTDAGVEAAPTDETQSG